MQLEDYGRIEKAIHYLNENFRQQPELKEIARSVHLSEYHFQRLFKRWAGISPKKFLELLTLQHSKRLLRDSTRSVLDAALDSGLSGPGRLHDLFVQVEAVSPGEYKKLGDGLRIHYGVGPTPFGNCLIAFTKRGICHLSFIADNKHEPGELLQQEWPLSVLVEDAQGARQKLDQIFSHSGSAHPLKLFLRGTNFQLKVWQALLQIPAGSVFSYEDVAEKIGRPQSVRAVASAVARNKIAYLIPCHRVIRKTGVVGEYKWGGARKQAILAWEHAGEPAAATTAG